MHSITDAGSFFEFLLEILESKDNEIEQLLEDDTSDMTVKKEIRKVRGEIQQLWTENEALIKGQDTLEEASE